MFVGLPPPLQLVPVTRIEIISPAAWWRTNRREKKAEEKRRQKRREGRREEKTEEKVQARGLGWVPDFPGAGQETSGDC